MKAQYILKAIRALDNAYSLFDNNNRTPQQVGTLMAELFDARSSLEIFSGLREMEITVEREEA